MAGLSNPGFSLPPEFDPEPDAALDEPLVREELPEMDEAFGLELEDASELEDEAPELSGPETPPEDPALPVAAARPEPVAGAEQDLTALNWLFVDLNSYFASVEQQVRPELRGRPVGVVPMMAETTVCLAASYEAKALGVKTGTVVAEARKLCPEIAFVEARHEIYVDYHHRIVEAVESCVPVSAVMSIDEMACRLMGRERRLQAALELGRQVKRTILERVGSQLRSSVGLATNRFLAKVAGDMEKPDGLVALTRDLLPEARRQLSLRDLPGVGARTEERLKKKGIDSIEKLMALGADQAAELWGSVWGSRLYHWLLGEDFEMAETEHMKSLSHQHVLGPEMRSSEKAWAVALKLLHKAAMRLRAGRLWASSISLAVGFAVPRSENTPVSRFGVPTRGWHQETRLAECQDNPTLNAALARLWAQRPAGREYESPYFISVALNNLVPDRLHSLNLFDEVDGAPTRRRLLATMDQINTKYGLATLAPATLLTAFKAAPTRIAFHSIPEMW